MAIKKKRSSKLEIEDVKRPKKRKETFCDDLSRMGLGFVIALLVITVIVVLEHLSGFKDSHCKEDCFTKSITENIIRRK